jgi:hypothetical protein
MQGEWQGRLEGRGWARGLEVSGEEMWGVAMAAQDPAARAVATLSR